MAPIQSKMRSHNESLTPVASTSVLSKQTTMTPFSIGMFRQLDVHPKASPARGPTLTPVVTIRPESIWNSLTKYRNFTLGDQHYAIHQYAIVSRAQQLPKEHHPLSGDENIHCVARILEIRAKDAQNVYVRVYWLYRPDDLPNGRQCYHGKTEYIATNHMEIVDALRFIRHTPVMHVNNEVLWLQQGQLACYWRQTYDYMLQKLSDPVLHCICSTPVNLDEQPVHCSDARCGLLMHRQCITHSAHLTWDSSFQGNGNVGDGFHNGETRDHAGSESTWKVELTVSERLGHEGQLRLLWTDLQKNGMRELDIKCLGCGQKIVWQSSSPFRNERMAAGIVLART
ncbi:MAG: hypothetical protein Q9183_003834 [Haloplaca sp. 2 TL-2023]